MAEAGRETDPGIEQRVPDGPEPRRQKGESPWAFWRSVAITLAVALGIRHYLVEARYIPSGSMLPGLQIQDRLLVEKITYRHRSPRRGEIVVFHAPKHFDPVLSAGETVGPLQCLLVNLPLINSLPGVANPACDAYIKRVVALPGERVIVNPRGDVYKRQHVLVLGDNRANSWDGRFWPGGPFLPQKEIIGRAFWRFFPFTTAGRL